MEEFFYARYNNGRVETKGLKTCSLGHKIHYAPDNRAGGVYAGWRWDGNTLAVENDRYGVYPLYYYSSGDEICVSPSIGRILEEGASPDLDYKALSVFLRMGFFLGEDTPFKAIRTVPPNATFQWSKANLNMSGGYTFPKKSGNISQNQAIDQYVYLFSQSIKRRLPPDNNFIIPLSGGRDSRHILLELNKLGYKPDHCVTHKHFPPRTNEDLRIAKLLAKEVGVKHKIVNQTGAYFKAEKRNHLLTNFCTDEGAQMLMMADYLRGRTKILYDGLAGGGLTSDDFLSHKKIKLVASSQYTTLAMELFDREEIYNKDMLTPDFYKKVNFDLAVDYMASELKRHQNAPNPLISFYQWTRTRREIALGPYAILKETPVVYTPFLDHDLYDFLLSLDAGLILEKDFHTETIKKGYPKFAHIPYVNKNAPPRNTSLLRSRFIANFLAYSMLNFKSFKKSMNAKYVIPRLMTSFFKNSHWHLRPDLMFYIVHLDKFRLR